MRLIKVFRCVGKQLVVVELGCLTFAHPLRYHRSSDGRPSAGGVAIEQHYAACPTVLNYFCGELWRRRAQRGYHIQDIFDLDSFVFRKNHFALHFICFS